MKVYYGVIHQALIEVTHKYTPLPDGSYRITCNNSICDMTFGDPLPNVVKSIYVAVSDSVYELKDPNIVMIVRDDKIADVITPDKINSTVALLHSKIQLKHGTMDDELPEQKMMLRYFLGRDPASIKVLELGANVGRNTIMIANVLGEHAATNFVTMECDTRIASQLKENQQLNNLNFHICTAALSQRNLIQRGWDTFVSDVVLSGFTKVDTITWSDLLIKYAIDFNTLVLDCEGAFYYILCDMPEVLDNISLIIMENDYHNYDHKLEVDRILTEKGFRVDYQEAGGWGKCQNRFFEAWIRE